MTTSLRSTISDLAASFASSILDAIRQMSLDEILAETHGGAARRNAPRAGKVAKVAAAAAPAAPAAGKRGRKKGGRLERRSAGDITALVGRIVSVLEARPSGLRAEQIRDALGLESKELPRPLGEALSSRLVTKTGQKRATTYFARNAAAAKSSAKPTKAAKPAKAAKGAGGKRKASAKAGKGGKRAAKASAATASA